MGTTTIEISFHYSLDNFQILRCSSGRKKGGPYLETSIWLLWLDLLVRSPRPTSHWGRLVFSYGSTAQWGLSFNARLGYWMDTLWLLLLTPRPAPEEVNVEMRSLLLRFATLQPITNLSLTSHNLSKQPITI